MEAVLICYDLYKFVDGSHPAPPSTIMIDNKDSPNPKFQTWFRQDKLIFGALVGSITPSLIPLITQSQTSHELWDILANTYARPSRGHIKQVKDQIKHASKGSKSISEYMQFIKAKADELAILGKPMDHEDLVEKILDGLDDEYKSIADIINGSDTSISF